MEEKLTETNLWVEVGNRCLRHAIELLDVKTASIDMTDIEAAKRLVDIAVTIDSLELQWTSQTRPFWQASSGRLLEQPVSRSLAAKHSE